MQSTEQRLCTWISTFIATLLGTIVTCICRSRKHLKDVKKYSWPTGAEHKFDPYLTTIPTPFCHPIVGGEDNVWALTFLFTVARRMETQAEAAIHCQSQEAVSCSIHIIPSRLGCLVTTFLCPGWREKRVTGREACEPGSSHSSNILLPIFPKTFQARDLAGPAAEILG